MAGRRARAASGLLCLAFAVAVTVLSIAAAPQPLRLSPLDATGLIPYFIAEPLDGSGYRPGDSELATWALREWERSAGGLLRFTRTDSEAAALIRIHWLPWAADGALGHTDPSLVNRRVIASIDIRPDEERLRPRIRRSVRADPLMRDVIVYFVCLHEIGHALGLTHTTNLRDIMWSGGTGVTLPVYERYRKRLQNREAIEQAAWLSADDIARFKALWSN